jgi:glycerol-3-phosphate acyltransferase PlsY
MSFLAYILLAYLLGAIPWGFLIARWKGVDIRKKGSGATGATNVYRSLGLSLAVLVASLDVLKGVLVMLIAKFSINNHYQIAAIALAVILGHMFSIFLHGKGGKGVATTLGVGLVLVGWQVALIVMIGWICVVSLTRFMSLTNLIFIWIFPAYFVFVNPDFAFFMLGVVITLLVYWQHRGNIERLKAGTELQLSVKIGVKQERVKAVASKPAKMVKKRTKKVVKKMKKTAKKSKKRA